DVYKRQLLTVRCLADGSQRDEPYDALVLSPGAIPVRPPLPGIDLPGIFTLRNIPDSLEIRQWIESQDVRRAVVVGAGFIGLEMAENLRHRGIEVTVVEMLNQVMPPLDPEIAEPVARHLEHHGVRLALGDGVAGFEKTAQGLAVLTQAGKSHEAGLVILAIGVRPDAALAKSCGLEIGARGGIRVDRGMRTSDPCIWAVGDAVETGDFVLGGPALVPLAGPANRQGRIAADRICGRASEFRGVQGTAIVGLFGMAAASTGASEKALLRAGLSDYEKIYLHPSNHAGYYPGASRMTIKLLFRRSDGRILGAQAVGFDGVDKRMDVLAMAIQMGATVYDLEEAELCYAPQFGGAKDPVNFAGMIGADVLRGDMPIAHWPPPPEALLLDVRDPDEFAASHVPGALNIPLAGLRSRLGELDASREIHVTCAVGLRGYLATRILLQHGFRAKNLSGGISSAPSEIVQSGSPN
ncbi:MAG: FAD-dependent oxidoreductase, partial [Terrimicrobiaceae bacterium]|nr:FAD-dependent oxidoreductase [Terrimicrobiaceae bacterium]